MKRIGCIVLAFVLTLPALCGGAQAAPGPTSSSIISTALSQLDYEEGPNGETKYGQWYGIPRGHWCDMFVSWCANEAGIPKSVFPRSAGCTTHVRLFDRMGRYQPSAARGGSYVPQPGDAIFFYDYVKYPAANVVRHAGIVLCVENGFVFTIEGNTLTNRLDYSYCEQVLPLLKDELQPKDYVAVKYYSLDDRQIHGYAVPNYSSRDVFSHKGWVDLGKYEPQRSIFNALAAEGIMPGTSSCTFSPRHGMTRGSFLALVMNLYGLSGWDDTTVPFADVPEGSSYFDAAMSARSAGIVNGTGDNQFHPDTYLSGIEAQAIISRTLAYVGQENQQFEFSQGDLSYMLTPYTIRADIAGALHGLRSQMSLPAVPQEQLSLNGEPLDWPMLRVDGSIYVPLETLRQAFPQLTVSEPDAVSPQTERLPIPMYHTDRVFLSRVTLQNGSGLADVSSFCYHGTQYIMLHPTVNLLGVTLQWQAGSSLIELFLADLAA